MSTTNTLRERRSAAQLHALAEVRKQIGRHDSSSGRQYLKQFTLAFRSYEQVLQSHQLQDEMNRADIILVGDYHALPASQRYAARLVEQRSECGNRPVVLAVETIFTRDQHILDQWWRREIIELELRRRIRFDFDWGYDWDAFYELLTVSRERCEAVYGIDCMPRHDFRKIAARDRHAAHKISEIRRQHPQAVIIVLCGESHLAPAHLPRLLRAKMKKERVLTVLQNVDPLYWRAAGERDGVEAVRVNDEVVCVFNSTPLEKYESYRLWLTRFEAEPGAAPDVAPTIYNLIASLARFLGIDPHCSRNGTHPKFLVDSLPEVYTVESSDKLARQLARDGLSIGEIDTATTYLENFGCVYVPQVNTFCVQQFHMMYAAEEAARFLHHACRGFPLRGHSGKHRAACFHARVIETSLAFLGSLMLHPQPSASDDDEIPETRLANSAGKDVRASAELLGSMLGEALYRAYLKGRVSRSFIRQLFITPISKPADAKKLFDQISAKLEKKHSALSNRHSAH